MRRKIYFASDFHLGAPNRAASLEREQKIVRWLEMIQKDAQSLYLMGDLFDFWFEYKHVVPKGYIRFLGKLAEISDAGIDLHIFVGNHDLWMKDYLSQELNAQIYTKPIEREWGGKKFYLAHGDGLGPGDYGYKMLKKVFTNPIAQWLFAFLHPYWGIGLATYSSQTSRNAQIGDGTDVYLGDDKEWLFQHAKTVSAQKPSIDYFVFGHRHLPIDRKVNAKSRYVNLGDWINYFTYAEFDGKDLLLKNFEPT